MGNTNASATLFGWDFQINAALVLMLENIEFAEQVRVEGQTEDIEIKLDNGQYIYSQAKSVVNSWDHSHVKRNLEKALTTLSNASKKPDCNSLIYITNSPNPLSDKKTMSIFYGPSRRAYKDLPPSSKTIINEILQKISADSFDIDKFEVRVVPFETDDLVERYKVIKGAVDRFIVSIRPSIAGISQDVLEIWQKDLFGNGTMRDPEKVIKKKDLVWPLIVLMTDIQRFENPFTDCIDEGDFEEITTKYKGFINSKSERFAFATRVVSDYQEFPNEGMCDKILVFINSKWCDYKDEFAIGIDDILQEKLIKIILYQIVRQKHLISDMRKRVHI